MKKIVLAAMLVCIAGGAAAQKEKKENWLMTHDSILMATQPVEKEKVADRLELTVEEAQQYALKHNRSLHNSSVAIQQAYAQRWQTIAQMLPQVDMSWAYTNYCGYSMEMNFGGMPAKINMPNSSALNVQASVGVNGQGIVGILLQNLAIDMQRLQQEQSEENLCASIRSSYATVLVLQEVIGLLEQSVENIDQIVAISQRSVAAGVMEQTQVDQIAVRTHALKNSINANKRNIQLALSNMKVLLDVPAKTELVLTSDMTGLLSGDEVLALLGEDFVVAHNLSYQQLEKNVDMAKMQMHMAGWAYGPTVAFAYQHSKQHYYGDGGMRMTPPNLVSVNVSMPLWSSGKREAGVIEKKIALETARNTLEETADQLGIQYEQLRYNLQNAYETYLSEKENMKVTDRVFNSVVQKTKYGVKSNLELVNASNDVVSAQSSYVQAVMQLVNAKIELEKFLRK